jgi:hypothetical protein
MNLEQDIQTRLAGPKYIWTQDEKKKNKKDKGSEKSTKHQLFLDRVREISKTSLFLLVF